MKLLILSAGIFLIAGFAVKSQDSPRVFSSADTTRAVSALEGITIKGHKALFSTKAGNMIVNVENSVLSAISDPVDLLSKVPTVMVSPDGESISIIGKGQPLIYIDNQKMSMNDLRSLPVADIKTIEIINNPSSKYEAEGRSVILITRKLTKYQGIKMELAESAAYRKYYLNRTGLNFSYRKKKIEIKTNFQYNWLKTWEGNTFDFRINNTIQSGYNVTAVTTRPQFIAGGGVLYQINDADYISVNTSVRTQNTTFPIYTDSYLTDGAVKENAVTTNMNGNPNTYSTSSFNYNKKLKKLKGQLFTGAQYTKYISDTRSVISNSFNYAVPVISQIRRQNSIIDVWAIRADFEKTFKNEMKWELGSGVTFASSNGFANILNHNPSQTIDAIYSYREKNYAGYTRVSGKLGKLNYSGGLRLEDTHAQSAYSDNVSVSAIDKRSTQFFPKMEVIVPVDSSKAIIINYSTSIARPDYSNADQTSVYINPHFEWSKNINLKPSVTRELSAKLQYQDCSVTIAAYHTKDPVYSSFDYNAQETRLSRRDINYEKESGVYLSAIVPFKYKFWNSTNVMNIFISSVKDPAAAEGNIRPYVYCSSTNEVRLPKSFTLTVYGWIVTKSYQGALERNSVFNVDTSITKTLVKDLSCTVRFNNMFRSVNSEEQFAINDVAANGRYFDNSREFSVGLKYALGNLKSSIYKNKNVDENGDRVK